VWDGLKFALPFGVLALGFVTTAVTLFGTGRGSWMRALLVAIGACVAGALLFWGFVWLYEALDSEAAGWVIGLAIVVAWVELTGLVARRVTDRS